MKLTAENWGSWKTLTWSVNHFFWVEIFHFYSEHRLLPKNLQSHLGWLFSCLIFPEFFLEKKTTHYFFFFTVFSLLSTSEDDFPNCREVKAININSLNFPPFGSHYCYLPNGSNFLFLQMYGGVIVLGPTSGGVNDCWQVISRNCVSLSGDSTDCCVNLSRAGLSFGRVEAFEMVAIL